MNYYISDTHFGHANIINLCNRPFKNVNEMDETMIKNWNNVVSNDDNVYVGGDFCYKNSKNITDYLSRLNGNIYLVSGNHDAKMLRNKEIFNFVKGTRESYDISDKNRRIIIYHYPIVEWNGYFRNSIHLYGHIHNSTNNLAYKVMKEIPNAYNIGADILGFTPRTLEEVIELNKKFQSEH